MPDLPPDDATEDARPWERPGAVRRDVAPHRGERLRFLAGVALACALLAYCLAVPALVALPLGVAVRIIARRDLARMAAGRMDPAGGAGTAKAATWAFLAAVLAVPPRAVLARELWLAFADF